MFAVAVDSQLQVCQKEQRMTNEKNNNGNILHGEGFLLRYLRRSPNSGFAVVTELTCKQMLEDNHGYVRMSMQG